MTALAAHLQSIVFVGVAVAIAVLMAHDWLRALPSWDDDESDDQPAEETTK